MFNLKFALVNDPIKSSREQQIFLNYQTMQKSNHLICFKNG